MNMTRTTKDPREDSQTWHIYASLASTIMASSPSSHVFVYPDPSHLGPKFYATTILLRRKNSSLQDSNSCCPTSPFRCRSRVKFFSGSLRRPAQHLHLGLAASSPHSVGVPRLEHKWRTGIPVLNIYITVHPESVITPPTSIGDI